MSAVCSLVRMFRGVSLILFLILNMKRGLPSLEPPETIGILVVSYKVTVSSPTRYAESFSTETEDVPNGSFSGLKQWLSAYKGKLTPPSLRWITPLATRNPTASETEPRFPGP